MAKANHTPAHSIRIRQPLWEAAKRTAAKRGETVTDAVVRYFERTYAREELQIIEAELAEAQRTADEKP